MIFLGEGTERKCNQLPKITIIDEEIGEFFSLQSKTEFITTRFFCYQLKYCADPDHTMKSRS